MPYANLQQQQREEEEEYGLFRDRQDSQQQAQQLTAEAHWRQEAANALQMTAFTMSLDEEPGTSGQQQVQQELDDACLLHLGLQAEAIAAAAAAASEALKPWHTGECCAFAFLQALYFWGASSS